MNAVGTGTEAHAEAEANRRIEAENGRRDAAGIIFLAAMLIAGALTVITTLAVADAPAPAGTSQATVTAP